MPGELACNGHSVPLTEFINQAAPVRELADTYALAIFDGDSVSLSHQGCSFLIRSVPRPRRYPVPMQIDWRAQSHTGVLLAGAVALLARIGADSDGSIRRGRASWVAIPTSPTKC